MDFDLLTDRRAYGSLKWDVKKNELPMWVADMDFAAAPCIQKAIIRRAEHGIFGYSVVPPDFAAAVCGWWKRRHGLSLRRSDVIFATGIVPAISSIVNRVTNVGDNVVVLTPVYDIFFHSIENFGRHTAECKLIYKDGKYSIDFNALERVLSHPLTTLMILCNPHNPIGKIWTEAELCEIARLCKKYGVIVISDEIHCDIVEPKKHYVPFLSVAGACKTIMCVSASKAFNIAGLQAAAVVVPDKNLKNIVERGLNSNEVAEPNCFAIDATVAAFNEGEQWLEELNAYLFENRRIASEFFAHSERISLVDAEATYLLWLDCERIAPHRSTELNEHIRRSTGLVLSDGAQYRGNGDSFLRMNIACPRARLLNALPLLKK